MGEQLECAERVWAIESAGGLGYLLAQQLLAAGETVVDVPATLAARVRVLGSGRSDKNDPNDARSVAIVALRAPTLVPVRVEDHVSVLRLLARRHRQIGWACNKAACRLHADQRDRRPAGSPKKSLFLRRPTPRGLRAGRCGRPGAPAPRPRDARQARTPRRTAQDDERSEPGAVAASGTTLTAIFGVGDVVAATLIGHVGDIARFATADRFAAYNGTAPTEWSSGNPTNRSVDCRGAETAR